MKLVYFDSDNNQDYRFRDNPYCKVRIVFKDDNDTFIYYSDDLAKTTYINKVRDTNLKPDIFSIDNLDVISSDEQYYTYVKWIDSISNFQDQHQGEKIDGNILK